VPLRERQYNRGRDVHQPFDAVLVIAFGGPHAPSDVRPFLENVLRGRRVAPGRVEEVARHYELVGGRSPITELTMKQVEGLRSRLAESGVPLPVFVGMRNWHPFLADTLAEMSHAGIRRAVGFIAAAHRSYSSCMQYRENVAEAREELLARGLADVEVTYVADWFDHASFIAANAERVKSAFDRLDPDLRPRARLIFTAHSIPESMAATYPYREQFEETARRIATEIEEVRLTASTEGFGESALPPRRRKPDATYATVYQSRSGRPEDPWLGPDICDYLREERARGLEAAVICPIGFVCDHVEVLYDLDIEAAAVCQEIGLPMVRAEAVNDHPRFLDMMADVVLQVCRRYAGARPLEVVAGT
jgi:protoporphyrin/coproporphyrin ferrochelatase